MRIWNAGALPVPLGCLSRLMIVDMCVPIAVVFFQIGTHLITMLSIKTTPPNGITSTERGLTTTVNLDNEAAMKDHITPPQGRKSYIWRFLALSAIGRNVIHITATTEREAREQSPAGCVMVFAGRLPVQEVRYA
ncbi:host cell division inhibitor Icd-like protein [Enterobacter hormaechei]|uniref:host cell division inhibitor Icd-like protein n=1 Tax=Enterobacter hormaechei TaxID=158836 RepID=UPI00311D550F